MHPGIILFYLPEKGYGYLRLLATGEDFHFRTKNLRVENLVKGELVRFRLMEGRQGYYADEIVRAGVG